MSCSEWPGCDCYHPPREGERCPRDKTDADRAHVAFHEWFSRWVELHGGAPAHFDAWLAGHFAGWDAATRAAAEREAMQAATYERASETLLERNAGEVALALIEQGTKWHDLLLEAVAQARAEERTALRTELETAFDGGFTAGGAFERERIVAWLRGYEGSAAQATLEWAADRLGEEQ